MKIQSYSILFFIYFILPRTFAVNRIWLIRHCDKTKNISNPCCSNLGYERASLWHQYFEKYIQKQDKVKIYTSNFTPLKQSCINNINYQSEPNTNCQKSQRMFLTAYYLQNTFKYNMIDLSPTINIDYCIGEKYKLLERILKEQLISDAIVVWEHKEIIDIIRSFNIEIKKWKNKFKNVYNLVFMIDVQRKLLFYDCFDYVKNEITNCSEIKNIEKWLFNFNHIDRYTYTYNKLLHSSKPLTNYEIKINYIKIVSFAGFFLLFIVYLISIIIKKLVERRRSEYVIII